MTNFAGTVVAAYTGDPDSARYSSVLDENGNIDRAKVDEEVILKVTQEILKRTADGDTDFLRQIAADRSLIDRLLNFIRGIKNSITIKLTGSEMAMLDEAERNLVNLMRGKSQEQITDKFSLKTDSNGNPYVVIDEDILAGVPKSQWVQTVKKEFKSHRINMGAFEVVVNAITRNEYINSKYTKYIERTGEGVYADKLRMVGNIDEIVQNAYNTRNEDARHKNFPSFNRSEINVRIGNRDYAVEVVTGINFNNNEILYDIVGIRTTKIKEAKTGNKVSVKNTNPLTRSTASNKNISQENYTVNQSAQTRQKNTTKDNKRNIRYSYGGIRAANVPGTFLQADMMQNFNYSAEEIRKETGWFKGADGKWRFEIDDSKMKIYPPSDSTHRLGDIAYHPVLFEQYPQLEDVTVEFKQDLGALGQYDGNKITISKELQANKEQLKKTLIHEIQHWIQAHEGFAGGANTNYWEKHRRYAARQLGNRELQKRKNAMRQRYRKWPDGFQQLSKKLDSAQKRGDRERYDALEEEAWEKYEDEYDEYFMLQWDMKQLKNI